MNVTPAVTRPFRWDLVVINPSAVFGPPYTGRADGSSLEIFQKAFDGELSIAVPDLGEC